MSESNNSFDHYIFILQYGNGTEENQTFPKEDTTVELSSLVAGVEYNISVKTKSGKLESTQCESTIIARTSKPINFYFYLQIIAWCVEQICVHN